VLCDQLDSRAFPRLPEPQVLDILRRYALSYEHEEQVGHTAKTPVSGYLDPTRVTPESLDQRVLAGHLAYHVAQLVNRRVMRPTLLAVSKVAATSILSAAADRRRGTSPDRRNVGFTNGQQPGNHKLRCCATYCCTRKG
jgi:hypothetical protein